MRLAILLSIRVHGKLFVTPTVRQCIRQPLTPGCSILFSDAPRSCHMGNATFKPRLTCYSFQALLRPGSKEPSRTSMMKMDEFLPGKDLKVIVGKKPAKCRVYCT
jgi:hypothetical protein